MLDQEGAIAAKSIVDGHSATSFVHITLFHNELYCPFGIVVEGHLDTGQTAVRTIM